MFSEMIKQIKTAFSLLVFISLLVGLLYPGITTAVSQIFFAWRANGSLIENQGKLIGSELIGQSFTDPKYFWSRPSATTPFPYNAMSSTGSNLGPSNPDLITAVKSRIDILHHSNLKNTTIIPVELVTTSASGLDPEISPAAAYYQISRIATARQLPITKIQQLVNDTTQYRTFSILGEARINVLELNLALDKLH